MQFYNPQSYECTELLTRAITEDYLHKCDEECEPNCEIANGHRGRLVICRTCHNHLKKNNIPPECQANGLQLSTVPEQLRRLNTLEKHLVSRRLPFMKIVSLPKGGQSAVIGPVTCVPSDIQKGRNVLPRSLHDADIVTVSLKRKLEYKSHYIKQLVNLTLVDQCLKVLKETNPMYTNIHIAVRDEDTSNENCQEFAETSCTVSRKLDDHPEHATEFQPNSSEHNRSSCDLSIESKQGEQCVERHHVTKSQNQNLIFESKSEIDEYDASTDDYDWYESSDDTNEKDDDINFDTCEQIKEHSWKTAVFTNENGIIHSTKETETYEATDEDDENKGVSFDTCMQPIDLASEAMSHYDMHFNIAPAEKEKPVSIFYDKKAEALAFPVQFPSGENTLHADREKKFTPSKYFNAHPFCADNRFAKDPQFIFFAQYATELSQVTSSISIKLRQGGEKKQKTESKLLQ